MNAIDAGPAIGTLMLWVGGAIGLAIAATYFLRPRTRKHYRGGPRRYLAAVAVQAIGFMTPIPIVLILLFGQPVPAGLDVVLAVAAGVAVYMGLRYAPVTGPLLKDLHRARVDAAIERLGPRS